MGFIGYDELLSLSQVFHFVFLKLLFFLLIFLQFHLKLHKFITSTYKGADIEDTEIALERD